MIFYEVAGLLASIQGFDSARLSPDTPLSRDGVKPIDLARLVIACEKRWRVTLHDDEVIGFRCLGDLAAHIERMLADALDERSEVTDEDRTAWFYE